MSESTSLALLSAVEQARRIRAGELTASELLDACMGQVEGHNEELNAVVTLNPLAEQEAARVDEALARGEDPGPLAGIVVGIKDVTETADIRTTYGSPLFADHVPHEDAVVVKRFRDAGAVILGKTNTPEFAAGGNTWNEVFGATRNPWDPSRSAGGSTGGGAVAVATGMISLAQGTDLGGSLRIPASFCGVVGLRPTPGLIPTLPSAYRWDDLAVTGTIARTAEDIWLSLGPLAGPHNDAPVHAWTPGLGTPLPEVVPSDLRLAYCPDIAGIGMDPHVERVCRDAVEALRREGTQIDEIALDLSDGTDAFLALRGHWFVSHFADHLDRVEEFGVNVAANLQSGLEVTTTELGAAEHKRAEIRDRVGAVLKDYGALLTPCMAIPPFPVDDNYPAEIAGRPMKTYIDWVAPTFLLSLTGLPVAAVPAGLDSAGTPVGLQLVLPATGESRAIQVGSLLQATCPVGPPTLGTRQTDGTSGNNVP